GAVGQGHSHAEDEVAGGSVAVAQRTRVTRGHDAADGGAPVPVGGIETQPLPLAPEGLLGASEGDARAEHGGEVTLVVLDERVEALGGDLELRRLTDRPPIELG